LPILHGECHLASNGCHVEVKGITSVLKAALGAHSYEFLDNHTYKFRKSEIQRQSLHSWLRHCCNGSSCA